MEEINNKIPYIIALIKKLKVTIDQLNYELKCHRAISNVAVNKLVEQENKYNYLHTQLQKSIGQLNKAKIYLQRCLNSDEKCLYEMMNPINMIDYKLRGDHLDTEMLDLLNSNIIGSTNKITKESDMTPIVGSSKWKIHKYPGDIDMLQIYVVKGLSKQEVYHKVAKEIIKAMKELKEKTISTDNIFLSDAKIGLNIAFNQFIESLGKLKTSYQTVDLIEYFEKDIPGYDQTNAKNNLDNIKNLISISDFNTINKHLDSNVMTGKIYTDIYKIIRKYYILRWTIDEIISGIKYILNYDNTIFKIVTLEECLDHDTIIKFDVWGSFAQRYIELTNIILIKWVYYNSQTGKEDFMFLGKKMKNIDESYNHDIDYYSSKEHENCVKLAKRIWNRGMHHISTSKNFDPTQFLILKKLFLLFTTDINIFSQMKADIELLQNALDKMNILGLTYQKFIKFLFLQIDRIPYNMFRMVYIPKENYENTLKLAQFHLTAISSFIINQAQKIVGTTKKITTYNDISDQVFINIINYPQNLQFIKEHLDEISHTLSKEQNQVFCKYLNEHKLHPRIDGSLVHIKYSYNYLNLPV